jgi:hypothetical protein
MFISFAKSLKNLTGFAPGDKININGVVFNESSYAVATLKGGDSKNLFPNVIYIKCFIANINFSSRNCLTINNLLKF